MTHLKTVLISLFITTLFAACNEHDEANAPSQLVVEGWIDAGEFPIVKLTHTIGLTYDGIDINDLSQYVDRWARVSISDGEREVVMIGRADRSYYPPYIYTTSEMRGEQGKTYRLKVEASDGTVAEAVTTIPAPVAIDSFSVEPVGGTLDEDYEDAPSVARYQLYAYTSARQRCKLFTRVVGRDDEFLSSYLGVYDSTMIGSDGRIAVNRGRTNLEKGFSQYFGEGDTVMVKFSAIDDDAYEFWRNFEDMADLSRNPLFPVTKNLHSNVSGALGYWFGYGSTFYPVKGIGVNGVNGVFRLPLPHEETAHDILKGEAVAHQWD